MPPKNRNRRNKRDRRPNVFVQQSTPVAGSARSTGTVAASPAASPETTEQPDVPSATRAPRRIRRTRSEVYARTFPLEIRKMGIITGGVIVALAVFTVVL